VSLRFRREVVDRHAGQCLRCDHFKVVDRELANLLEVASQHSLERLDMRERRPLLDHEGYAIQAVDQLRINWMLNPERAVLIEGGDTIFRRHEIFAGRIGRRVDEVEDSLLRRTLVP
jgi:hypothetical protein